MNLKACLILFVIASSFSRVAAHDLKAELTALAPAGKTFRLVYVKGGQPQNFNQAVGAGVYAVSSEDGIIRKIYPAGTGLGDYSNVNMTDDGRGVIFYDRGKGQTVFLKFDGTLIRTIASDNLVDYWINPQDKTEWAVVTNGSAVTRININTPGTLVAVTTKAPPANVHIDVGLCTGISDDGKKVIATYEAENGGLYKPGPGLLDVVTNTYTHGTEGCWPQMRSGTPIQLSQNNGAFRHRGPQIINEDGTLGLWISSTAAMDSFFIKNPTLDDEANSTCFPEEGHASDGHRWLRDRNYLTFTCQRSKVNPILWRVSDRKWTYIEDGLSCTFAGDMEGVVGSFSPSNAKMQPKALFGSTPQTTGQRIYSIDGRNIAASAGNNRLMSGVVICKTAQGTMTRVYR